MSRKFIARPVWVQHVCNRCGTKSTPIDEHFRSLVPHGWAHFSYVDPKPLADNIEMDFCTACSLEVMKPRGFDATS